MGDKIQSMQLGGGGASAPSTPEPMIAPGMHRPDWPTPDYALPKGKRRPKTLNEQIRGVESYADALIISNQHESAQSFAAVVRLLENFADVGELPQSQLMAALDLLEQERSQPELWDAAYAVDEAPVRGGDDLLDDVLGVMTVIDKLRKAMG